VPGNFEGLPHVIDLHSHTTASDGQHSPDELFALAKEAGVTTLAVTDHDTVAGLGACQLAAARLGLTLVPGIEVSAFLNRREVHILGHFIDPTEPALEAFAKKLKVERFNRMQQMVDQMKGLGFPVSMDQVRALAGDDTHLARPHLARVLVELGYCTSTKEAFTRFLADGKPGAAPRYEVSAEDAIALIRAAHGVATLAHPGVSKVYEHEIAALKSAGLEGLEVEHSDHPPSLREKLRGLAKLNDLVATAGSDFHGEKVAPLRKLGSASMKPEDLERLRQRAS
jgi:3',5'-nucleoside bisphosphate phosphatase